MKAPSKKAVTQIVQGPHAAFPQTAKHCLHVVVWIKTLLSCLFPLFLKLKRKNNQDYKGRWGWYKGKKERGKRRSSILRHHLWATLKNLSSTINRNNKALINHSSLFLMSRSKIGNPPIAAFPPWTSIVDPLMGRQACTHALHKVHRQRRKKAHLKNKCMHWLHIQFINKYCLLSHPLAIYNCTVQALHALSVNTH